MERRRLRQQRDPAHPRHRPRVSRAIRSGLREVRPVGPFAQPHVRARIGRVRSGQVQRSEQSWPAQRRSTSRGAAGRSGGGRAGGRPEARFARRRGSRSRGRQQRGRRTATATRAPAPSRVDVEWDGGDLRVTVRDKGCGMAPRMDSPGAGLGLPLIASLADSFSVAAPPGGGTEVCMTLPAAQSGVSADEYRPIIQKALEARRLARGVSLGEGMDRVRRPVRGRSSRGSSTWPAPCCTASRVGP